MACIEDSLNARNHGVAHTTFVLKTSCPPIKCGTLQDCHPALPKDVGHCRPILGLCAMPKLELANMTHLLQRTKGLKKMPLYQ